MVARLDSCLVFGLFSCYLVSRCWCCLFGLFGSVVSFRFEILLVVGLMLWWFCYLFSGSLLVCSLVVAAVSDQCYWVCCFGLFGLVLIVLIFACGCIALWLLVLGLCCTPGDC